MNKSYLINQKITINTSLNFINKLIINKKKKIIYIYEYKNIKTWQVWKLYYKNSQ